MDLLLFLYMSPLSSKGMHMIWCFFYICYLLIEDVFAGLDLSGTYQLQTPMTELEKGKKTALERTVQSADWVYQIPISMRLKDKPHICETYVFEATETHFHVTCDSLQTLSVPISGKKEKVQRVINGKTEEIELQFHSTSINVLLKPAPTLLLMLFVMYLIQNFQRTIVSKRPSQEF